MGANIGATVEKLKEFRGAKQDAPKTADELHKNLITNLAARKAQGRNIVRFS